MDKAEMEFNEKKEIEAAAIKLQYDQLAEVVKIDSKSLISALLKKKDGITKTAEVVHDKVDLL